MLSLSAVGPESGGAGVWVANPEASLGNEDGCPPLRTVPFPHLLVDERNVRQFSQVLH
jgi:hypothetical protein